MKTRVIVVGFDPAEDGARVYALTGDGGPGLPDVPQQGICWTPADVLDRWAHLFEREGVIVMPGRGWTDPQWREAAAEQGWTTGTDSDSGWYTWRKAQMPVVHVCHRAQAAERDRSGMVQAHTSDDELARTLHLWHEASGVAWRMSPGVVGTTLMRAHIGKRRGAPPLWIDKQVIDGDRPVAGQGDIDWVKDRSILDQRPWLVGFDLYAQYLSAVTTLRGLPVGDLLRGDEPYALGMVGWWLIDVRTLPATVVEDLRAAQGDPQHAPGVWPSLIHPARVGEDHMVWASSPILEYLVKGLHWECTTFGSWAPTMATQLLGKWAEHMRDLREVPALATAAKRVVNEGIGMLGHQGGRLVRPDWRWLIIDQARVNLFRKIEHVMVHSGAMPVAIRTDAVWYLSEHPDVERFAHDNGIRLRAGLGGWQPIGAVKVADWKGRFPA